MEINYALRVNNETIACFRDYALAELNFLVYVQQIVPDGEFSVILEDGEGRILYENKCATYCFRENQEGRSKASR